MYSLFDVRFYWLPIWLLTTSSLLSCATTPAPSSNKVDLHFRWSSGTQLQVERQLQVKNHPELDVKHFFSWHLERHPDGLVLLSRTSHAQGAQPLAHFMQMRSVPAVVVDAWGQYVGFDDPKVEQEKIGGAMQSSFALLASHSDRKTPYLTGPNLEEQLSFDDEEARLWWNLLAGASAERVFKVGKVEQSNIRIGDKEWVRRVTLLSKQNCPQRSAASLNEEKPAVESKVAQCVWLQITIRQRARSDEALPLVAGECDAKILTQVHNLMPREMIFSHVLDEKSVEHRLLFGAISSSDDKNKSKQSPPLVVERWLFKKVAMKAIALPMGEVDTSN